MSHASSTNLASLSKDKLITIIVWAVLTATTIVAWLFAPSHDFDADHRSVLVAVIVFLGFIKSLLVAHQFMELRHAPKWLQFSTQGWMAALWLTMLIIYYVF